MNKEESELEEFRRRVAVNSGIPMEEINQRWDQFLNKAVTSGLSKDEGDEIRKQFRQQAKRKADRAAKEKAWRDAEEARQAERGTEWAAKETEAERMLDEKEAEISRLESKLSRGDIGLVKSISLSWKLGAAQTAMKNARREIEKANQAKAVQQQAKRETERAAKEKAKREAEEEK